MFGFSTALADAVPSASTNSASSILRSGALFVPQSEVHVVRPNDGTLLGFRQEAYHHRYLHIDGEWRDHLGYAMTAEDVSAEGGLLARWHRMRTAA